VSVLFGMEGVEVTEAERGDDGRLMVWARITLPAACPGCGTVSESVRQYVTIRPRDVRSCGAKTDFFLVSRRMVCAEDDSETKTFTESVPQVPPRCSITRRLPEHAGSEVADRGIAPSEAGLASSPGPVTLVPSAHTTRPRYCNHPGQLANGCCRTRDLPSPRVNRIRASAYIRQLRNIGIGNRNFLAGAACSILVLA
jgi:hypothetical protein